MAFFRQLVEALHLQTLVFMSGWNLPDICCRGHTEGHKQTKSSLECTDDSFWTQVIKECFKGDALLVLIIRNKKELGRD